MAEIDNFKSKMLIQTWLKSTSFGPEGQIRQVEPCSKTVSYEQGTPVLDFQLARIDKLHHPRKNMSRSGMRC
jgi:hypothetical protein